MTTENKKTENKKEKKEPERNYLISFKEKGKESGYSVDNLTRSEAVKTAEVMKKSGQFEVKVTVVKEVTIK